MSRTAAKSPLPKGWEVPAHFKERLGTTSGRQRAMNVDGHVLLILHAPPKPAEDLREGRFFWRTPQGDWRSSTLGGGISALNAHVSEYESIIDKLEELLLKAHTADALHALLREITPLARATRNLHATLQQAREMVSSDADLIATRDVAYGLERQAELLLEDTKYALEHLIAKQAEEQARQGHSMALAGHRLNTLAALFLPTATIAALLGMNLKHGFEDSPAPWGVIAVLLVGAIAGFLTRGLLNVRPPDHEQ